MTDLVGTPEDLFSRDAACLKYTIIVAKLAMICITLKLMFMSVYISRPCLIPTITHDGIFC